MLRSDFILMSALSLPVITDICWLPSFVLTETSLLPFQYCVSVSVRPGDIVSAIRKPYKQLHPHPQAHPSQHLSQPRHDFILFKSDKTCTAFVRAYGAIMTKFPPSNLNGKHPKLQIDITKRTYGLPSQKVASQLPKPN